MVTWTLRAAGLDDTEFLFRVYASTRVDELAVTGWSAAQQQAFLRSQFAAQDYHYRTYFPATRFDIVQVEGCEIGRLYVERNAVQLHVLDIALLPEHRGRGIGSALMRALMDEAAATARKVVLHVERHNPAFALYQRLGFVEIADQGLYIEMHWQAASPCRVDPTPAAAAVATSALTLPA
jgi:ribosomal protein S18 acetylase RimI-like enzyme